MYENIDKIIADAEQRPMGQKAEKYSEAIAKLLANLVELQVSGHKADMAQPNAKGSRTRA